MWPSETWDGVGWYSTWHAMEGQRKRLEHPGPSRPTYLPPLPNTAWMCTMGLSVAHACLDARLGSTRLGRKQSACGQEAGM